MLLKKGVYPYEYMNTWERFEETNLPPKEAFQNSLKNCNISDEEYAHAQNVWSQFDCKTIQDYHDIYLKTDVLLLADIFETFRQFSKVNYRLDPAHYVSSPQLSWDAMLLHTEAEIELIADPQMFSMIDKGIRGGVAMIVKRYAKANNPKLGNDFNPNLPTSYIIYLDANNLYGWAMSQYLPFRGFHWLKAKEWKEIDWTAQQDAQPLGYFIECDLLYDKSFHDMHNDYPLAPERIQMNYERLNETQLRIFRNYRISKSSLQVTKLVPHLLSRKNIVYIILI